METCLECVVDDIQTAFGELRSLLEIYEEQYMLRQRLWQLMETVSKEHLQQYQEQWIPYISTYAMRWKKPMGIVSSVEELKEKAAIAPFAHFELVILRGQMTPANIKQFVQHVSASQVSRIRFFDSNVTIAGVRALVQSDQLTGLRHLELESNQLPALIMRDIILAPWIEQLESLSLYDNGIGDNGVMIIKSTSVFSNLKTLDLGINTLTLKGVRMLADSPALSNLTSLNVASNNFDRASGHEILHRSPYLSEPVRRSFAP